MHYEGKGTSDNRLTYLLRPNVTRPDRRALAALDTPPVTDLDYSSNYVSDTDDNLDSDFVSERELESDIELEKDVNFSQPLPAIEEASLPVSPVGEDAEEAWSLVAEETDDSQADDFESGSEFESTLSMNTNILNRDSRALVTPLSNPSTQPEDPDRTLTELRPHPLRDSPSTRRREWTPAARSPSSPSLSPVRTRPPRHRLNGKKRIIRVGRPTRRSFYEYVFH